MTKNNRISVRVTREEKLEIIKKAESMGFDNLSDYIKWCMKEKIFEIEKMIYQNGSKK